jgi:hypothetical protein
LGLALYDVHPAGIPHTAHGAVVAGCAAWIFEYEWASLVIEHSFKTRLANSTLKPSRPVFGRALKRP